MDIRGSRSLVKKEGGQNTFRFLMNGGIKTIVKGNNETSDSSLAETAAREWKEEIGYVTPSFTLENITKSKSRKVTGSGGDLYTFQFVKIEKPEADQIIRAQNIASKDYKNTELFNLQFLTIPQIEASRKNITLNNILYLLKDVEKNPTNPTLSYGPSSAATFMRAIATRGGKRKTYRKKKSHRKTSKAKRK